MLNFYFEKTKILTIIYILAISQSMQAVEINKLSNEELSVVKKIGLSEDELRSNDNNQLIEKLKVKLEAEKEIHQEPIRNKFQDIVKNSIEPKIEEVKATIEKEKEGLKKDAEKLAIGYLTSTISLFAATLLAPQVIMVCKTKPSAVVYAGTAAIYIFQEMRNMKILKASQLAEMEMVESVSIDKTKTVKENAKIVEEKLDQQIIYIKAYKNTIDHTIVALKNKAKNAKIVSIGFLAASATAAAEQMDWLSGGGTCATSASLEKINFSRDLDYKYEKLIENAKKTEDKWAYYYEWESLKFGINKTLTSREYQSLAKTPVTTTILINAMNFIQSNLLASALAVEDSKKVTVAEKLKNNKAADWIGDLDKLGIVGGVAVNVVAYMAGWQMNFLKSVIANGTSRSIIFGVQGALAFTAGKLFEDAASNMGVKLQKIENLIDKIQSETKSGIRLMTPSEADARHLKEAANRLGIPSEKLISEMNINEATSYIKKIKEKIETTDDQEGKAILKKYESELSEKNKNTIKQLMEKPIDIKNNSTYFQKIIEQIISTSNASTIEKNMIVTKIIDLNCIEKKGCPNIIFPKSPNPNAKILNQYLSLYERYYQGVKNGNVNASDELINILEKNKSLLYNFRSHAFKKNQEKIKSTNTNYSQNERAGLNFEINNFRHFYTSLSPAERLELDAGLNPLSTNVTKDSTLNLQKKTLQKTSKLTSEDLQTLRLLIDKLEDGTGNKTSIDQSNVMPIQSIKSTNEEYNFGFINIHPKELELFEIIHNSYLKFILKNYPDLLSE